MISRETYSKLFKNPPQGILSLVLNIHFHIPLSDEGSQKVSNNKHPTCPMQNTLFSHDLSVIFKGQDAFNSHSVLVPIGLVVRHE